MASERDELVELSAGLRRHLTRARDRGRRALHDASLRAALDSGPAPGPPVPAAATPPPAPEAATPPAPAPAGSPAPASPSTRAAAPSGAGSGAARNRKLSRIEIEPEAPDYAERMEALAVLGAEAGSCTQCGLCKTRTNVAFARGSARNAVMFVGEAPGADEDRLGSPFVGKAGKLLDQIVDAIGLDRETIYVANILKCRPPNNRDPLPDEIATCTPYLERQIELVRPKIICALGRFAAQFLTDNPKVPMGKLRGTVHTYKNLVPVVPTYHPAALLRNPQWKKLAWEDVQLLRREYLK